MTVVGQLAVATMMVVLSILLHLAALAALLLRLRSHEQRNPQTRRIRHDMRAILEVAFGLFALHTVEIWSYAMLYDLTGAVPDFESALYFSTSSYTTVGYGDLVLDKPWRLLGAIESANGLILLGWSTAFFVAVVSRIRLLERAMEARDRQAPHRAPSAFDDAGRGNDAGREDAADIDADG